MLQSCASLPCRYPRHHSTFPPPSQVMCFTSRHVSPPRQAIGHAQCLHEPQLSFPSARNAHQRTVGALLSVYRTVPPCFAAVLQLRETQFRMPAGMFVLLSSNGHWTTSAWLRVRIGDRLINVDSIIFHVVLSQALKQMPSQPAFRVLTQYEYESRLLCTDGLQTT